MGEERRGWCPSRSGESVGWYGDGVGEWRFGEDGKADGGVPLMLMVVTLTIPTNVAAQRTDVEDGVWSLNSRNCVDRVRNMVEQSANRFTTSTLTNTHSCYVFTANSTTWKLFDLLDLLPTVVFLSEYLIYTLVI
jgi:hypothetical protein